MRFACAVGAYSLALWLSLFLMAPAGSGAAIVWPVAAVGLAMLFFWGYELWPAIVVSFFIVLLARGVAPPLIATTAIGNTLEALLGVYILQRYVGFIPMFSRLRDTLGFIATALGASLVSATVITAGVSLFGSQPVLNTPLLLGVWIGHTVSLLSFGPFVLRWLYRPLFYKTAREVIEGLLVFGSYAVLIFLLFWTPYTAIGGISLLYVSIIPLLWAALRTGPRGTTLTLFLLAAVAATGIVFGYGPIAQSTNVPQALFGTQMVIGTLSLIFLLFTSLTEERKNAISGLKEYVGKLEEALKKISSEDQAKSDFIAILAHELRNPLSPLLSGLELMKTREQGPPEILRMMGAHLHTVARLLDDLLDISRISQKKFRLQKQPVGARSVFEHTLEMVKPQFEERHHTLNVKLPQEEIWLQGDPVRLAQIFVNLLNNAAKYTSHGGTITLEVVRDGTDMVARVTDTGIGIPKHRLSKLFEAFGGDEGSTYSRGGLRLGLSLAKRMTEMHHGTIQVYSAGEGSGSEFTVRIPLLPVVPLPLEERPARPRGRFATKWGAADPHKTMGCILVVDDNRAAADSLGVLLRHSGYEVAVAYSGTEALDVAAQRIPSAALLDIGLPDIDGYELATALRLRFGKDITLVALTGYGQVEDQQKARAAGFDAYLVKPASIVDVERVLAESR